MRAHFQEYYYDYETKTKIRILDGWGEGVEDGEVASEVETTVGSLLSREVEDTALDSAVLLVTSSTGDDVEDDTTVSRVRYTKRDKISVLRV